jgi:DNA-binding CsgD family transcriptional regulator
VSPEVSPAAQQFCCASYPSWTQPAELGNISAPENLSGPANTSGHPETCTCQEPQFPDAQDCAKIQAFTERVLTICPDYPQHVVNALAEIFDWRHCDFWLNDRIGALYRPVTSIGKDFVRDYQANLRRVDFFNPRNIDIERAMKAGVLCGADLMSRAEFEKTEYGRFLARYGFCDEMVAYLKGDTALIGTVALFHTAEEGPFTVHDKRLLGSVCLFIARALEANITIDDDNEQLRNLRHFADQSDTGLILFGKRFQVRYANQVAREICAQLNTAPAHNRISGPDSSEYDSGSVSTFLRNVLAGNPLSWVTGYQRSFVLPDFTPVNMCVSPAPGELVYSREQKVFMVTFETTPKPDQATVRNESGNLTFRELEVVAALADGLTNQQIAEKLYISISAVKKHLSAIYRKECVRSRLELLHKVLQTRDPS